MRHIAVWAGVALFIVLVLSLTRDRFSASAQSGGSYDLRWNTIDNGGGGSSGGAYTLSGSIGQGDAGGMSSRTYTLGGGFWGGSGNPLQAPVFLPLIRR
jgi:hypothetical protein